MSLPIEITTLARRPDLVQPVLELVEAEFNYAHPHSWAVDFHTLFSIRNHGHCHAILLGDELVGHIGVRLRQLRHREISVPSALFGGIAIKKKFQGRGLFRQAFERLLDSYGPSVGLFFLWSAHTELYAKFDFYQCGGTVQTGELPIGDDTEILGHQQHALKELPAQDRARLRSLYDQHYPHKLLAFSRGEEDWAEFASVTSARLYLRRHAGTVCSYFFAHKGQDLTGIVHEQAGPFVDELAVYKVWLPEDRAAAHPGSRIIYSAFVRIGDLSFFSGLLTRLSSGKLAVKEIDWKHKRVRFAFEGEGHEEGMEEFLRMLFGPAAAPEFKSFMPPLFICGLDSV